MPVKIPNDLPVREILEKENIFVMDQNRATHQDIRPIQICILNLMPIKEDTELQILRELSNTPLQIDVTFMRMSSHESKHTSKSHLDTFYETFASLRKKSFDGLIVTGAPVEMIDFEQVDYWDELTQVFDWADARVTSTLFICWASQAALYHYYGIPKRLLKEKLFGVYDHRVYNRKTPLLRGFDDSFKMTSIVKTADSGSAWSYMVQIGCDRNLNIPDGAEGTVVIQMVWAFWPRRSDLSAVPTASGWRFSLSSITF